MRSFGKLAASILGCELVGILAIPFTIPSINSWYKFLNKPSFSPPNSIFGPVWTALYLLIGISFFIIWRKKQNSQTRSAIRFFLIQLTLNFLWSLIFFGLHRPFLALVDILALLVAILLTFRAFYKINKLSAYILIPYLLWVSFATLLNFSIVILNK